MKIPEKGASARTHTQSKNEALQNVLCEQNEAKKNIAVK